MLRCYPYCYIGQEPGRCAPRTSKDFQCLTVNVFKAIYRFHAVHAVPPLVCDALNSVWGMSRSQISMRSAGPTKHNLCRLLPHHPKEARGLNYCQLSQAWTGKSKGIGRVRTTDLPVGVRKPLPANSAALVTAVFLDGDPETGHVNG
ncbi:hypothetical protein T265_04014 [Opisthorchis viverrini]|uniref:Uncharacterized protein n=1 Tax=Opisthorchis viverrini TaxID=6198 RepID=A0A074ZPK9_OPIVI|nr:hypothetical protein T265_04014 [Opisthorchis viverrini]KER29358.1 hypothetical protein T265_04014 [Opisthorchis viverrini]